jgi:hypothetical protein
MGRHRWMYYATGSGASEWPGTMPGTGLVLGEEVTFLRQQAEVLANQMSAIEKRITDPQSQEQAPNVAGGDKQ